MLRYFYLLLLLVFIKLCFSEKYIINQNLDSKNIQSKLKNSAGISHRIISDKRRYRQAADFDEEDEDRPVAQIDVANFINSDKQDENNNIDAANDNLYELETDFHSKNFQNEFEQSEPDWNHKTNSHLKVADYQNDEAYTAMSPEHISKQKRQKIRFNREMNIGDLQNIVALKSQKDDPSDIESRRSYTTSLHNPQKKCAFKHLRIPFFSRDKSNKANKKGKKRKEFGGNYKKDTKAEVKNENKKKEENHGFSSSADEISSNVKISKRSPYSKFICPICKSVFRGSNPNISRVKRLTNDIVHNSRQFYGKRHNYRKSKAIEDANKDPDENDSFRSLENLEKRLSRQSASDEDMSFNNSSPFDKGQQLQELEEVERRINEIGERNKMYDKSKASF